MTDSRRLVVLVALALLAAFALGLTIVLLLTGGDRDDPARTGATRGTGRDHALAGHADITITGEGSEPMAPGRMSVIDLEFHNPHDEVVEIDDVRVTVSAVRAPNADERRPCSLADYAVEQVAPDTTLTVAAGATRSLSGLGVPRAAWPRVGLVDRPVNQDGCKGATVVLRYSAAGTIGR